MSIIIILLNLLVIVCFLIAGFFAMLFAVFLYSSSSENDSFKGGCLSLILGITFCIGGILILEYTQSLEKRIVFLEVLENGNRNSVCAKFSQLDYSEKEGFINDIFEKFYNNTFIDFASKELKNKEFSKWTDDENAWKRVVALNTVAMYREYLSHFPYGKYKNSAKKIILDYDYSLKKGETKKITNYNGNTTLQICNKSHQSITFSYTGTFAQGKENISGNGTIWITIPNGYYSIHVYSQSSRTRGDYSTEALDGGTKTLEYYIRQEYR